MNLIASMRTKLTALLQPMVDPLAQYSVREIKSLPFKSNSEIEEVVARYGDRLPGAYLSTPICQYNTEPSNLRVCNVTMNYGLLIGMEDRRDVTVRQDYAENLHDSQLQYLLLQRPSKSGIACSNIDFIRPQHWECDCPEDTQLAVIYLTFSVEVRNWQINTPA